MGGSCDCRLPHQSEANTHSTVPVALFDPLVQNHNIHFILHNIMSVMYGSRDRIKDCKIADVEIKRSRRPHDESVVYTREP